MQSTDPTADPGSRTPSVVERRVFVVLAAAYFAFVLAIVPWARDPGVDDPHVSLIVAAAILLANLGTALLLGAWYRATGRLPLLVLTAGYGYSAIMAVLHMVTFPGAMFAQPLFGDEQTVGWLYAAWRGGTAIAYLVAVVLEMTGVANSAAPRRTPYLVGAHLVVVGLCTAAAFMATDSGGLMLAGSQWTTANQMLIWAWVAVFAIALVIVVLGHAFNDTFYLWLSLVLVAAITDLILSNLGGGRYTLGWHASRASFVVSAYLLLVYLARDLSERKPRSLLPAIAGYGGALSAACAAVFLRWFLHPWLGTSVSFITLWGAVAMSVWLGGWVPATLCALFGYAMVRMLFIEPSASVTLVTDALQFGLFVLSSAFIIGLGEGMRRANDRYRASEAQLRENQRLLAAELAAMERLHSLSSRLLSANDLVTALDDVLSNAIASCDADFGNVQLLNARNDSLEIVAQRGFDNVFLDHFRAVRIDDGSVCARAMGAARRIGVEDVEHDPEFTPHRAVAAALGFRAVQSTPLLAHGGTVVGMLSIHFRTPRRLSEREEQLLDLYARHAADLLERVRFEQALKAADRRKDEFLATLAHELRNPLAPIRNAVAIMGAVGSLSEPVEKARQIIGRQVHHLVRLVDDLLDASRITLGKVQLRKEQVSLLSVLKEATDAVDPTIRAASHELHSVLPNEPLLIDADPTRIAQIFVNLLNNAAKFTARGGKIWLTAERQGDTAVISVRDTGIGISEEHLDSVFDMFSQPTPALYRTQGGLGIGLAIVRGLLELHGGSVQARSAGCDKGSEFIVRLPLLVAQAEAADDQQPAVPLGKSNARKRILVIDDNHDVASSLCQYLEMCGHEVREAHDGVEGIHMASEFKPDMVLLDIGMPRMNGYEAAAQIRERLNGHAVRIVAVTGWGHDDDRLKAIDAGFDLHMTKPVDPAAIENLL